MKEAPMKTNIWIMNHYAIEMLENRGGRHYWMAEVLKRDGYQPIVFGCNERHNGRGGYYPMNSQWQEQFPPTGVKYILIRSTKYNKNGIGRIINMVVFAFNLVLVSKKYSRKYGKPDIIYASSVHPLTVFAAEIIARYFEVPCIGEARDLWPETLVAYGAIKRGSVIANLLYRAEKCMYRRADAMIFTMEGVSDYIKEHKWDKDHGGSIDLNRVYYINNGVDLEQFDINKQKYILPDADLDDPNTFCIVYTGSIRRANNLSLLLDAMPYLEDIGNLKILIWGSGNEIEILKEKAQSMGLHNRFVFKGLVNKIYIPSIVCRSDCNIFHWEKSSVNKYGYDYNKLFDYLAAGKIIFSTIQSGHSLLLKKNCGIETNGPTPRDFADGIRRIYMMSAEERAEWGKRARIAAVDYDFKVLTKKLEEIIESQ